MTINYKCYTQETQFLGVLSKAEHEFCAQSNQLTIPSYTAFVRGMCMMHLSTMETMRNLPHDSYTWFNPVTPKFIGHGILIKESALVFYAKQLRETTKLTSCFKFSLQDKCSLLSFRKTSVSLMIFKNFISISSNMSWKMTFQITRQSLNKMLAVRAL